MIQWKLGCRSRKQKRKNQPIAKSGIEPCHWCILPLLLATPTMQFSLDRKQRRHNQNQGSASDSVGLIFTRSYRSTLLITTPTTTQSLVKTSLMGFFSKFPTSNPRPFYMGVPPPPVQFMKLTKLIQGRRVFFGPPVCCSSSYSDWWLFHKRHFKHSLQTRILFYSNNTIDYFLQDHTIPCDPTK